MSVRYFASGFRTMLAMQIGQRHGAEAWRGLVRFIALHESLDCASVRGSEWMQAKPYEIDTAFWHAVCGRNVDRAGHAELYG